MTQPYDPVAYQAELDAKCGRAGSAWLPTKLSRPKALTPPVKEELREKRLRIELLLDPELVHEIPPDRLPDDLA